MRHYAAAAAIAFTLSVPAHAAGDPIDAAIGSLLHGLVHERDVGLLFGYLHQAFDGALEGREVPPPAALAQRAEEIGDDAKRRGATAGHAILDAIERSIRESMRAPRAQPSPSRSGI